MEQSHNTEKSLTTLTTVVMLPPKEPRKIQTDAYAFVVVVVLCVCLCVCALGMC